MRAAFLGRLVWLFLFGLLVIAIVFSSPDSIAQEGGTLAMGDQVRVPVFGRGQFVPLVERRACQAAHI